MLKYTGNPYVDAGVAVLELRLQKPCDQFTVRDLESQALEIEREYKKPIWRSYLRIHFFNCAWTQADLRSEKSRAYIENVLGGFRAEPLDPRRACFFCFRTATLIADRSYIPLLAGKANMSLGAAGIPGLPVCGYCIFAVHFYPFGTIKVQRGRDPGRPLFWWTSVPAWTRKLTQRFYFIVEKYLAQSPEEFTNLRWPATQLLRAAREALDDWETSDTVGRPPLCDVIGIHATNSGLGPDYDELHIPRGLLEFWSEAGAIRTYRQIEQDAWEINSSEIKKRSGKAKRKVKGNAEQILSELDRPNTLYEALGEALRSSNYVESAKRVAERFFLRRKGKNVAVGTTRVAELFLERVANMQKERLDAIREIADTIAVSPSSKNLIDKLMRTKKSLGDYLATLRMVQRELSLTKKSIPWERILLALDLSNDDDASSSDVWLVSELVLIRIFERLSVDHPELLSDIPDPDQQ